LVDGLRGFKGVDIIPALRMRWVTAGVRVVTRWDHSVIAVSEERSSGREGTMTLEVVAPQTLVRSACNTQCEQAQCDQAQCERSVDKVSAA